MKHESAGVVPSAATRIFGANADRAAMYVEMLATDGVERGLIGPREVDRLWDRHVLNCAVVADLLLADERVIDVGSGAGLPGIPMALARQDVDMVLLEPMQRRVNFLHEVADALQLPVTIERGRAEDAGGRATAGRFDVVVSRAVAPLDRLARYCLPLVREGGRMIAIKGERASEELSRHAAAIGALGSKGYRVTRCGDGLMESPTTVVEMYRSATSTKRRPHRSGRQR